jgi:hypothetical protein
MRCQDGFRDGMGLGDFHEMELLGDLMTGELMSEQGFDIFVRALVHFGDSGLGALVLQRDECQKTVVPTAKPRRQAIVLQNMV